MRGPKKEVKTMRYGVGIFISFLQDGYEALETARKYRMRTLGGTYGHVLTSYDPRTNTRRFIFYGIYNMKHTHLKNSLIYAEVHSPLKTPVRQARRLASFIEKAIIKFERDGEEVPADQVLVDKFQVSVMRIPSIKTRTAPPTIGDKFTLVISRPPDAELPPEIALSQALKALPSVPKDALVLTERKAYPDAKLQRKYFYMPTVRVIKSPNGHNTVYYVPLIE